MPAVKPFTLLLVFISINFINYMDRGVVAAVQELFSKELGLTNFQSGVVAATFMVGFVLASPIFAHLVHRFNGMRLIAVGLSVWCISTVSGGLSKTLYTLALFRMFVGVGEASFVSLAPPYVVI